MADVRTTLGIVACLPIFATACTASGGRAQQVQEVGSGIYSIGVRSAGAFIDGRQKAMFAAVDKAGEYCRSKGLKLADVRSGDGDITFQCVSGYQKPE